MLIIRQLSENGMLDIKPIAESLNWKPPMNLTIRSYIDPESNTDIIIIKKTPELQSLPVCYLCGSSTGLVLMYDKYLICPSCRRKCQELLLEVRND